MTLRSRWIGLVILIFVAAGTYAIIRWSFFGAKPGSGEAEVTRDPQLARAMLEHDIGTAGSDPSGGAREPIELASLSGIVLNGEGGKKITYAYASNTHQLLRSKPDNQLSLTPILDQIRPDSKNTVPYAIFTILYVDPARHKEVPIRPISDPNSPSFGNYPLQELHLATSVAVHWLPIAGKGEAAPQDFTVKLQNSRALMPVSTAVPPP
jgi:hypothetical protein